MLDRNGDVIPETGLLEFSRDDYGDYWDTLYDFKVANGWNFTYTEPEEAKI